MACDPVKEHLSFRNAQMSHSFVCDLAQLLFMHVHRVTVPVGGAGFRTPSNPPTTNPGILTN